MSTFLQVTRSVSGSIPDEAQQQRKPRFFCFVHEGLLRRRLNVRLLSLREAGSLTGCAATGRNKNKDGTGHMST